MRALVYHDYIFGKGLLLESLKRYFDTTNVAFCDSDDILDGALDKDISLLVMPGGADLYYCEKLSGEGCTKIRKYVENGGNYLGICAGAYFACENVQWAMGSPHEISGPRELCFYKGTAKGPIYEFIEESNIEKSWQAAAVITLTDNTQMMVRYEAGPIFEEEDSCKVLARYEELPDKPPAIIETSYGKGNVVLCSPHLENTSKDMRKMLYRHRNASYNYELEILEKIAPHDAQIEKTWRMILDHAIRK
jgi:glutamine amidotransferase-like uncharacterized protein